MAQRSARLQRDLGVPLRETDALRRHLERNPIDAWTGGAGTGGVDTLTSAADRDNVVKFLLSIDSSTVPFP